MPPIPGTIYTGEYEFKKEAEAEQVEPISKEIMGVSVQVRKNGTEAFVVGESLVQYTILPGESLEFDINDIAKLRMLGTKGQKVYWLAVAV